MLYFVTTCRPRYNVVNQFEKSLYTHKCFNLSFFKVNLNRVSHTCWYSSPTVLQIFSYFISRLRRLLRLGFNKFGIDRLEKALIKQRTKTLVIKPKTIFCAFGTNDWKPQFLYKVCENTVRNQVNAFNLQFCFVLPENWLEPETELYCTQQQQTGGK